MRAYIYMITNIENDYKYIGIARDRAVMSRWHEHTKSNSKLGKALSIYGISSFTFQVIEEHTNITNRELLEREKFYIRYFNAVDYGYNTLGGETKPKFNEDDLSDSARKGLMAFNNVTYLGNYGNSDNKKLSFWNLLQSQYCNILELIEGDNYLTRSTSKYREPLLKIFMTRRQRFFKINFNSGNYMSDNISSIITFLQYIDKVYTVDKYYFDNYLNIEIQETGDRIEIYSVLRFDDELEYHEVIDDIFDLMRKEDH